MEPNKIENVSHFPPVASVEANPFQTGHSVQPYYSTAYLAPKDSMTEHVKLFMSGSFRNMTSILLHLLFKS